MAAKKSSECGLSRTVEITEQQHERLRELSERMGAPVSEYVRQGLEIVLDIAERQQRMVEQVQEQSDGGRTEETET